MVVSGGAVSTVNILESGDVSTLPKESLARTSKMWEPSERVVYSLGLVQAVYAAPSIRHSNVAPASGEEKPKEALFTAIVPDGPESMVVSGAVLSTVQVRLAGVASMLAAASVALTSKVWEPSVSLS